ncbi:MAG: hypothetical protein HZT40_11300 [Candidatus Thiothrix singaporensis]|uniref:Uncharacterized protein n=1 Tax=Candidatus Thiothrix singaporensis TaxID=2799669 RepID=A0A7L6ASJ6_9GAMM|nr:MAG: hypothetical protein HZT40_11300 [Candidatus Thiothrix singaporensis]
MTAIATVGMADFQIKPRPRLPSPPFRQVGQRGLHARRHLLHRRVNRAGRAIPLPVPAGRDTAFQELRGKLTTGQITSFSIRWDDGGKLDGWFSRDWFGKLEYHGPNCPPPCSGGDADGPVPSAADHARQGNPDGGIAVSG